MEDDTEDLINITFKLYKSTPLIGFDSSVRQIGIRCHALAKRLCDALQLTMSGKRVMKRKDDMPILGEITDIQFTSMSIPDYVSYDSRITPMELSVSIHYHDKDTTTTNIFILLPSVDPIPNSTTTIPFYPLLLVKARSMVTAEVLAWLHETYSNHVNELKVPPSLLGELVELWSDTLITTPAPAEDRIQLPGRITGFGVELDYVIPSVDELSKIKIKLNLTEATKIKYRVRDFHTSFLEALRNHLLHTTKINVSALVLDKSATAIVSMNREGKMKVRCY
ncbi:hypothetical protein BDB01DRAFT_201665 [Pilobolus umbonatus]|nr:hypothetical protein BDB01DRAFT_201665 [Pilobolus umbonatus]